MEMIQMMTPYWDPHFLIPVLEWIESTKLIPDEEINEIRVQVFSKTLMHEECAAYKKSLGMDVDEEELEHQIATVNREISDLETSITPFKNALLAYKKAHQKNAVPVVSEKTTTSRLSDWWVSQPVTDQNRNVLKKFDANIDKEVLKLSNVLYKRGKYEEAKYNLDFYLNHVVEVCIEGAGNKNSCSWGLAAILIVKCDLYLSNLLRSKFLDDCSNSADSSAEFLSNMDPEDACRSILRIYDYLESNVLAKDSSILERSWLIHWALWLYFRFFLKITQAHNVPLRTACWSVIPEWLVHESNIGVVTLVCPHLLRYYSVYAILNRAKKDRCQTIVQAITASKTNYSDSFTLLLEALFIDFDFDAAQQNMTLLVDECSRDFFLAPLKDAIEENSRLFIFETYCRIHKSVNLNMIAQKLNMSSDIAEKWIVDLIRNAKLEAKIDSAKNRVEMCNSVPNVYQQVVSKTRSLIDRTAVLVQTLSKLHAMEPIKTEEADYVTLKGRFDKSRSSAGFRNKTIPTN